MLLLDLTHTSHTRAQTGIQKVCRSLHEALASAEAGVTAVCHDPFRSAWRTLRADERANLAAGTPAARRSARWPLRTRLAGRLGRLLGKPVLPLPQAQGLIVPEIFSQKVAGAQEPLFASVKGPRIALFHDAIALKYPELSPPGTVGRFPGYLRELLKFDGIAAVSEDSRDALRDYWAWLGAPHLPPVEAIPLGIDDAPPGSLSEPAFSDGLPVVLSVGTLEARKNHLALLDGCESLWTSGLRFELHLIGMVQAQTGQRALERLRSLQSAGRPIRFDGPVTDDALHAAYQRATFSVYPSLMEGFGLPVLESLRHGRPCICSARGALGESARGGGCLALDQVDSASLAKGISHLLTSEQERARLAHAARNRPFKTWRRYADDLVGWMDTLAPHR